jgi:hypothetical protein
MQGDGGVDALAELVGETFAEAIRYGPSICHHRFRAQNAAQRTSMVIAAAAVMYLLDRITVAKVTQLSNQTNMCKHQSLMAYLDKQTTLCHLQMTQKQRTFSR